MDGGGRGGEAKHRRPEGDPDGLSRHQQASDEPIEGEAMEAEGFEIRCERWMDRWVLVARVRWRHDDGHCEWLTLLEFQTGHYEWSDPHVELQSLALQVARRLE